MPTTNPDPFETAVATYKARIASRRDAISDREVYDLLCSYITSETSLTSLRDKLAIHGVTTKRNNAALNYLWARLLSICKAGRARILWLSKD